SQLCSFSEKSCNSAGVPESVASCEVRACSHCSCSERGFVWRLRPDLPGSSEVADKLSRTKASTVASRNDCTMFWMAEDLISSAGRNDQQRGGIAFASTDKRSVSSPTRTVRQAA